MDDVTTRPWLADWRRRIAELYAEIRLVWPDHPDRAWETWRTERERLYRGHPQSPVPAAERDGFRARHWPYDDRLQAEVRVEAAPAPAARPGLAAFPPLRPVEPAAALAPTPITPLALPNSGGEALAFDRLGAVTVPLPAAADGQATLGLFWMRGYAGGLFLPLGDATNGAETYGAGRYLLDTAKGADLGGEPAAGTLIVDLNFAFQPSCAFDPQWACPLAPAENRVAARVEAGERLR